ncbi:collagen alpha-1(I) chain-like [Myotis daubentonii]|uniref:collagen alpha-1(I) chain-like n=1 Tax=Myotis daubentonii TaxID=98922 RepID=UPI002873832D|nr:collagen alpha-1(I) chain-like [Myotis daubentonii]
MGNLATTSSPDAVLPWLNSVPFIQADRPTDTAVSGLSWAPTPPALGGPSGPGRQDDFWNLRDCRTPTARPPATGSAAAVNAPRWTAGAEAVVGRPGCRGAGAQSGEQVRGDGEPNGGAGTEGQSRERGRGAPSPSPRAGEARRGRRPASASAGSPAPPPGRPAAQPAPRPPGPRPARPGPAPTSPARSAPTAVGAQISLLGACALARSAAELSRDPAGPAGSCRAARRLVLGLRASSYPRSPRGRRGAPAPLKTGFGRALPRTVLCGIARTAGPDLCALRCSDPGRPGTSLTPRDPPLLGPGGRRVPGRYTVLLAPSSRPQPAPRVTATGSVRERDSSPGAARRCPRRGCGLSALLPEGETWGPKTKGPEGERMMEAARGLPDLTCDASNGMRTGIPLQPTPGSWTQARTREPWAPLIAAAVSNCWGTSTPPGSGFEETRNRF